MKWMDYSSKNYMLFGKLKNGDGFEKNSVLYIKVNEVGAFDVIHNRWAVFHDDIKVLRRDCEIIFH